MKIVYITGGLTPYRIAFCDCLRRHLEFGKKGEVKLFWLTEEGFNSNYDNSKLMRPYGELLKGKTIVLPDHTTRFMINPEITSKVISEKPDFIIMGGSWTNPSTWMLLAQKRKLHAPVYFWAESHYHNGLKRKQRSMWKEFIKKKIYNRFDGFFVPGKYAAEAIQLTKCKNCENCIKLPNLIENNRYVEAVQRRKDKEHLRAQYNIENKKTVLFTPSRLVDLKGLVEFLENGKVNLAQNGFVWIIAGMGSLKDQIANIAEKERIDVRLVGFVDQDTIIDYLALSDWFLLPSLSDPNPLSVIEALWAELPLALSIYTGNNPEVLKDGVNGILFDTLSSKSVNNALNRIKRYDSAMLERAAIASGTIARRDFDMEEQTEKIIGIIEEVLSNNE